MEAFLSGGNILLAILGFAFVIFIHELGHFAFAKWAGVRVEVFSIGFGPIVWSRTIGDTRYALSLLPLGGYVRMLGQEDMPGHAGEEEDSPDSYQSKHPGWKAAILFGGVLFNFVSSWLILVALAFYGMPHFPPVVGHIATSIPTMVDGEFSYVPSPALQLGLQRGDRIVTLNGEKIRDFEDILFATLSSGTEPVTMEIERDGKRLTLPAAGAEPVRPIYNVSEGKVSIGIGLQRSRTVAMVENFGAETPLRSNWRLEAINGEAVGDISGQDANHLLLPYAGQEVDLTWSEGGEEQTHTIRYAGEGFDHSGMFGLPVGIMSIMPDSAGEDAGLRKGDIILAINGEPLSGVNDLRAQVVRGGGSPLKLQVARQNGSAWDSHELSMEPRWDAVNQQYLIGISMGPVGSGRLPGELPPTLGGLPSPLVKAGVEGGSIMVDSRALGGRSLSVRILPPETTTELIPLSEEAWLQLDRFQTVAVISKLVGFRDTPASSSRLLGARLLASGPGNSGHPKPGWLAFEAFDGGKTLRDMNLDFSALPSPDRSALLAMPLNSYVISTSRYNADGQRCLEVAIPPADTLPTTHQLQSAPIGTAIAFGIEERPYELESFGEAFTLANHKSTQMIGKTLALIPRFFQPGSEGGISAEKSLQGPIGIFSELKARLEHLGFPSFLRLIALIGLNLFLINLLPIPITDGGQLVILGIEVGIRRPIPPMILNIVNSIGFLLIISLMLFVVGLDVARKIFGY